MISIENFWHISCQSSFWSNLCSPHDPSWSGKCVELTIFNKEQLDLTRCVAGEERTAWPVCPGTDTPSCRGHEKMAEHSILAAGSQSAVSPSDSCLCCLRRPECLDIKTKNVIKLQWRPEIAEFDIAVRCCHHGGQREMNLRHWAVHSGGRQDGDYWEEQQSNSPLGLDCHQCVWVRPSPAPWWAVQLVSGEWVLCLSLEDWQTSARSRKAQDKMSMSYTWLSVTASLSRPQLTGHLLSVRSERPHTPLLAPQSPAGCRQWRCDGDNIDIWPWENLMWPLSTLAVLDL